jgi:hypothetical protein
LGGEIAGVVALLGFGTLPLVVWQAQIAYVDFFATLFTLTAALVLVVTQRIDARSVIVALGCLIAGLAVKSSFILVAPGLALIVGLIVLGQLPGKVGSVGSVLAVIGLVSAALWITGNYFALAQVPALSPVVSFLTTVRGQYVDVLPELGQNGAGRSLADLIRLPLDLVQQTELYGEYQTGFTGFLLLALAPLVVLVRLPGRARAVLLGALASLLIWFAIAQYVRYALPIIAILCALGATAYATLWRRSVARARIAYSALPLVLAAAGLIGYLNTILVYPGLVPYQVVLGQQSKAAYLADRIAPYTALQLLSQEPNATRAWTAADYARL